MIKVLTKTINFLFNFKPYRRSGINKGIYYLFIAFLAFLLCSCGFFDKDNTPTPTPLTSFTPEVKAHLLWSTRTGVGSKDNNLKLNPVLSENAVITASANGTITSINKNTGHINWQIATGLPFSAGPGVENGVIVVCSHRGDVIALSELDGRKIWRSSISGEVLANPAVGDGIVVIKTIDGYLRALSLKDGHLLWAFQQVEPNLVLRGASAPLIRNHNVIVGFSNGNLAKLNVNDGQVIWLQTIAVPEGAFAIQRMIDIDADPTVFDHHIYVATYQGKVASLEWLSGRVLWAHDISSYTGMATDTNAVYLSDSKSHIWSFGSDTGFVNWRQTKLEARNVTSPVSMGEYIVLGDAEGYLHWLNKHDGHFAGRIKVGAAVFAAPMVEKGIVYVLTTNGYLSSYAIG